MKELLKILALTMFFLLLAVFGLAIKSIFKKNGQLTTCNSSGSGDKCGCLTQQTCSTDAK